MLKTFRSGIALAGAALATLMFSVGHPTEVSWWVLSPIVFAFVLSPMIVAYAVVSRTEKLELRWTMAVLSIGYTAFAGCTFYAVFAEPDATSGLAFFAVPVFGWFGLPVATILAAIIIRLRERSAHR